MHMPVSLHMREKNGGILGMAAVFFCICLILDLGEVKSEVKRAKWTTFSVCVHFSHETYESLFGIFANNNLQYLFSVIY